MSGIILFRNPRLLLLVIGVIAVAGLSALATLPRMEDPILTRRFGVVRTVFPGADAERVESQVTQVIEEELNSVKGIKEITSDSMAGMSTISIELKESVEDVDTVWSLVRDELSDATRELPEGAHEPGFRQPEMKAYATIIALKWESSSPPNPAILGRLSEDLEISLRAMSGTESVRVYGRGEEEILVELDPDVLRRLGMTAGDVASQIEDSEAKLSAGMYRGGKNEMLIEIDEDFDSLRRLGKTPIRYGVEGRLVNLSDIADLSKGIKEPPNSQVAVDGHDSVALAVFVRNEYRIDLWTRELETILEEFEPILPPGVGLEVIFTQNDYVGDRLEQLAVNLGMGTLAVVIVIFLLMGWRSMIVVGAALPLSALMVLSGMKFLGIPIHQMSITGLIIALGLLIDNAIVIVDEVRSRLRDGLTKVESIAGAISHLALPLFGSTLTTTLAFMPIAILPGASGEFVGSIAVSVILAINASFLLAMTVVPALAALMQPEERKAPAEEGAGREEKASPEGETAELAGEEDPPDEREEARPEGGGTKKSASSKAASKKAGSKKGAKKKSSAKAAKRKGLAKKTVPKPGDEEAGEEKAESGKGEVGPGSDREKPGKEAAGAKPAVAAARTRHSFWRYGFSSRILSRAYHWALVQLFRFPVLGVLLGVALPIFGFHQARELSEQFFPAAGRNQFHIELEMPASTALTETRRVAMEVRDVVLEHEGVTRVHWFLGESSPSFFYNLLPRRRSSPFYAQALVEIEPGIEPQPVIRELQKRLDSDFPRGRLLVRQLEQGPPFDAPVEVRLLGPDLAVLQELGNEIRLLMSETREVVHTRSDLTETVPKLSLHLDEYEARMTGLSHREIARQLYSSLEGMESGTLIEATEEIPIRVRLADETRSDAEKIASLELKPLGPRGRAEEGPPLSALGQLDLGSEVAAIPRINGKRVNEVKAYITAGTLPDQVISEFRERMDASEFTLPPGYRIEFAGEEAKRDEAVSGLMANVGMLIALMIATLVTSFRSFRVAAIIAAVGGLSIGLGLGALWVFDFPFGFMGVVGTMGLVGVALNDAIVVMAGIRESEGARNGDVRAIAGVVEHRTRHIIATTLTTMAGFTPLILGGGSFWPPVAITIAGGVGGATILALFFVPSLYLVVFGKIGRGEN